MTFDNLLISLGATKCGTTWLYKSLSQHPDLKSIPVKEMHYFTAKYLQPQWLGPRKKLKLYRKLSKSAFERAMRGITELDVDDAYQEHLDELDWFRLFLKPEINDEWFASLFESIPGKYMVDFGNQHFRLEREHLTEISEQSNNLKVLYTIRKPSKRLWSHARFHLERSSDVERLRDMSRDEFVSVVDEHKLAVHGDYADVISKLQDSLESEQFRVSIFEDLVSDPAAGMAGLERFLDISQFDYDAGSLGQKVNVSSALPPNSAIQTFLDEVDQQQFAALDAIGFELPARWLS